MEAAALKAIANYKFDPAQFIEDVIMHEYSDEDGDEVDMDDFVGKFAAYYPDDPVKAAAATERLRNMYALEVKPDLDARMTSEGVKKIARVYAAAVSPLHIEGGTLEFDDDEFLAHAKTYREPMVQ
jgi:hypothetical protein